MGTAAAAESGWGSEDSVWGALVVLFGWSLGCLWWGI